VGSNCDTVLSFIKQTTCFGPCTGPSSGLNLPVGGDYTVLIFLKSWFVTGYDISLFCRTVIFVKL
jgi:hypothetical protein